MISELSPDSIPTRGTFPRRNRLISALSDAVVVVEAPVRSGALITARHALEQGRGLFVAPGRPGDFAVAGCLELLRETPAQIVVGPEELVLDLGFVTGIGLEPGDGTHAPRVTRAHALGLLSGAELDVARAVCRHPQGIDQLAAGCPYPPGVVAGALTLLQVRGWVHLSGTVYLPAGPLLRG